MAIRTLDEEMFDKITGNTKIELSFNEKENPQLVTQDELQYLYDKAKEELAYFNDLLIGFQNHILDMFCGPEMLSTEEARNFFCSMDMFANDLIPAMLTGDYKEAYKYCSEEITEDELDESREEFFGKLYNKYLKR